MSGIFPGQVKLFHTEKMVHHLRVPFLTKFFVYFGLAVSFKGYKHVVGTNSTISLICSIVTSSSLPIPSCPGSFPRFRLVTVVKAVITPHPFPPRL